MRGCKLLTCLAVACRFTAVTAWSVVVRQAVPSDFPQIAELRQSARPVMVAGGAGFMGRASTSITPQQSQQNDLQAKIGDLLSGSAKCFVAVVDDTDIVGTVDCKLEDAGAGKFLCNVSNVLVVPSYRRQGHAQTLMAAALQYAQSQPQVTGIVLDVYRHNTAAIGLYRKLGFTERSGSSMMGGLMSAMKTGKMYMYRRVHHPSEPS